MPTPASIAELQNTIAQQTAVIEAFQPVLQASLDLTGVAVAKIDELFLLVQGMGASPTQDQIDQLIAAATAAKNTIAGDIASVNLRNAAVQAELDKVNQPPTTVG